MFRDLRRKNQQLPQEEAEKLLRESTSGVLALLGDEDYPYAVPLSHCYMPPRLYFHGAVTGHKVDAIRRHGKASFCVVEKDQVMPETLTTHFRSVIAFGKVRIVEDPEEKKKAIWALADRFSPGMKEAAQKEIDESWDRMNLFALDIEHITGKEARELMQQRREKK